MDLGKLLYDIVRAYIVALALTFTFFVIAVMSPQDFALVSIAILWYQITGLCILLIVTYRILKRAKTKPTSVGIILFLWTVFVESLFAIHSDVGKLTTAGQESVSGYTVTILSNIILFSQVLIVITISIVVFGVVMIFIRMVYSEIDSPAVKAILYSATFGVLITNILVLALLAPTFPDTVPALSVATAVWLQSTILSPIGMAEWFSANFELSGIYYYLLWVIIDLTIALPFTLVDVGASQLN